MIPIRDRVEREHPLLQILAEFNSNAITPTLFRKLQRADGRKQASSERESTFPKTRDCWIVESAPNAFANPRASFGAQAGQGALLLGQTRVGAEFPQRTISCEVES